MKIMDFDEEEDDYEFPSCSEKPVKNSKSKNENDNNSKNNEKKSNSNKNKYIKIIIFSSGLLFLVLLIVLIIVFTRKKPSSPLPSKVTSGGYLLLDYEVNEPDMIDINTIFNPSQEAKENGYSIYEIDENGNIIKTLPNTQRKRNLESDKTGKIKIKLEFSKPLTIMSEMFKDIKELIDVDFSYFNSENIIQIDSIFKNCIKLENVNFNNFSSKNIINMNSAFENCHELTGLNLSTFDTTNLKSMTSMLKNCQNLFILDIKNFKMNNNISYENWLEGTRIKIVLTDYYSYPENFLSNITANNLNQCEKGENDKCASCKTEENEKYKCKDCNPGYYLKKNLLFPTKCYKCSVHNCFSCSDNYKCDACFKDFSLNENKTLCITNNSSSTNITDLSTIDYTELSTIYNTDSSNIDSTDLLTNNNTDLSTIINTDSPTINDTDFSLNNDSDLFIGNNTEPSNIDYTSLLTNNNTDLSTIINTDSPTINDTNSTAKNNHDSSTII